MRPMVIAVIEKVTGKEIGFRLLDLDTYNIMDASADSVKQQLKNGIKIENLEIADRGLVWTQGSRQRYPSYNPYTKLLNGKSPAIILMELVNNSYRVCDFNGQIVDMTEESLIEYGRIDGIANGKIVDTERTSYISAINGEFIKDKLFRDKEYGEKLKLKMNVFVHSTYSLNDAYDAKLTNFEVEEIKLSKGVLGIQENGFKGAMKLKRVQLPNTLERLGKQSFMDSGLEFIEIPEGVIEIPERCFALCKELTEVHLPNSIRLIKRNAFYKCNKLSLIVRGPNDIVIDYGAIPRGINIQVRKN